MNFDRMNKNEIDIVYYHSPCMDGKTACHIAERYLRSINKTDVEYIPAYINKRNILPNNLANKNVLICDYSFTKEVFLNMLKITNNVLIIDHHKTAQESLIDIDQKNKIFDMDKSGAMLVWEYFYPDVEPPLFVKYVQDNDLFLKTMPDGDEVKYALFQLEYTFEEYEKYFDIHTNEKAINDLIIEGKIIKKIYQNQIDQIIKNAVLKFVEINKRLYIYALMNSPFHKSEIGHQVFNKYPFLDFSAIYNVANDNNVDCYWISLRSDKNGVDTAKISELYNGGGHKQASGCITYSFPNLGRIYESGLTINYILNSITYNYLDINNTKIPVCYVQSYKNKHIWGKYLLQSTEYDENICQAQRIKPFNDRPLIVIFYKNKKYFEDTHSPGKHLFVFDNKIMSDNKLLNYIKKLYELNDKNKSEMNLIL